MSEQTGSTTDGTNSERMQDEAEEEDIEWKRMTLYFKEDTKRRFQLWMNEMETKHEKVFDTNRSLCHEALIQVAMNNEEEFLEMLDEVRAEGE